jgi:hypothetical protein
MPDLAFTEIFGENATQTATDIIIKKADLPMTVAADNGGEQVLAAIVKKSKVFLSPGFLERTLTQNITVEERLPDRVFRTERSALDVPVEVPYIKVEAIIAFYKRDVVQSSGIEPDAYY